MGVDAGRCRRRTDLVHAVVLNLGNGGACLDEDVHDGQVGLQRLRVEAVDGGAAENGAGHQEVGGAAPVSLETELSRLVALAALYLEGQAGAAAPVPSLKELLVALHLVADTDTELLEHIQGNEHVRDALGLADIDGGRGLGHRQGHQEAGDDLRSSCPRDVRPAGDEFALDGQGNVYLAGSPRGVAEHDSEGGHDIRSALQRAVDKGLLACDKHRT